MFRKPKATTEFEWGEYGVDMTAGDFRKIAQQMDLTGVPDSGTISGYLNGYDSAGWQIKVKVTHD